MALQLESAGPRLLPQPPLAGSLADRLDPAAPLRLTSRHSCASATCDNKLVMAEIYRVVY